MPAKQEMVEFRKKTKQFCIGLTGGIAAGKSTVANLLQEKGYLVIDADQLSREAVQIGSTGLEKIALAFGPDILLQDGNLDRRSLRTKISENPEAKKTVEKILHPEIQHLHYKKWQSWNTHKSDGSIWFYEAALIFETKNADSFLAVWLCDCDPQIQVERLMKRDSCSRQDAEKMLKLQLPRKDKVRQASIVLDTNRTLSSIEAELDFHLKRIKKVH